MLGIGADLPFRGIDLWNAWELTWLDATGKPAAGTARIKIDAASPGIVGYQVQHTIQVTVRDVSRVGGVLDTLMKLGANHLNDVQFLIDDDKALLDNARVAAVREARRKAELFGTAAGVVVGEVMSMHEAGSVRPPPMPITYMRAAESVPVAPGERTLQVQVTVVFALREQ